MAFDNNRDRKNNHVNNGSAREGGNRTGSGPRTGSAVGKSFGRPAAGQNRTQSGSFGKPAGERFGRPANVGERQNRNFGKPAAHREGPYGRPATEKNGSFGRPAPKREGPYGRPAPARVKNPGEVEGMASRRIALRVLRDVLEGGAFASLSLDKHLTGCGLNPADRRLVTRLVYDTLDRLLYLDHALSQVMAREDTDIKLKNILRLGACQLLLEDRIPESAATNTCVQLCVELGMEGLKGVCNGILRNLVRKKDELVWPDPEKDPVMSDSLRYSVPAWLVEKLRKDWGEEASQIMSFQNLDGLVTIRPNLLEGGDAAMEKILAGKVWSREKTEIPHAWKIGGMADLAKDTDFSEGRFSIQSESSMLACMAVGAKRGQQILDACAAPGGKSCYLAEIMGGTGRVQAWDVHEHRVKLIESQVRRLHLENVRPMTRDASVLREDLVGAMDAVLLDAPCSGLGVMAEKPDIKYRVKPENVEELTALQGKLLETVSRYVKKGGILVYSTCSVLKDENENQVLRFLEKHPEFRVEKLPDEIPEKVRRYETTGLQILPHRDGMEGFYICRMKRV